MTGLGELDPGEFVWSALTIHARSLITQIQVSAMTAS
jgi:hypothetical protein